MLNVHRTQRIGAGLPVSLQGRRLARRTFLGSCALLLAALLGQAFLAGVAAMTDPGWWELHKAWVHAFQWLVLLLPACAVLAGYPRRLIWASTFPVVLIYLQYVWAELGRAALGPMGWVSMLRAPCSCSGPRWRFSPQRSSRTDNPPSPTSGHAGLRRRASGVAACRAPRVR